MNISKNRLLDGLFIIILGTALLTLSRYDKLDLIREFPFIALMMAYHLGKLSSFLGRKWNNKVLKKVPELNKMENPE